jgi:hypothetical protein
MLYLWQTSRPHIDRRAENGRPTKRRRVQPSNNPARARHVQSSDRLIAEASDSRSQHTHKAHTATHGHKADDAECRLQLETQIWCEPSQIHVSSRHEETRLEAERSVCACIISRYYSIEGRNATKRSGNASAHSGNATGLQCYQ